MHFKLSWLLTRRHISDCMYWLLLTPASKIYVNRKKYGTLFFKFTPLASALRPACEANRTTVHETQPVLGLDVMAGGIDYAPNSTHTHIYTYIYI